MALEVHLLGPLEVVADGGEPVVVSSAKQRAVLAMLALAAGEVVTVDRLAEGLWDELPASAPKMIQTHVWRLRNLLPGGAEAIERRAGGYVLHAATDVAHATRLIERGEDATALWRGAPLVDVAGEPFAVEAIRRLDDLHTRARESAVAAALDRGDAATAVTEARALADDEPLRERAVELLMRALYLDGRQVEALDVFAAFRARLDGELGLTPGPALDELQTEILTHAPRDVSRSHVAQRRQTETRPDVDRALGNLPAPRTRFVGREAELAHLASLLASPGLTTIAGPGGAGKTRLAIETGRHVHERFPDGVWLADLSAVADDPRAVLAAIAAPLGVEADDLAAAVASALARVLLLVDNCEHVVDAAAGVLDDLLGREPGLHVLATSREPLAIAGERVWRIPPLEDAVRLFVDRAELAGATDLDPDAVAELCRRLDGLPLAIELAAARAGTMPLADLARRLDDVLDTLTRGSRSAPGRHRTLRAAIDWSHDLLDPGDQRLLRRLAVFRGGFTLDAGQAVGEGDVTTLADRSLVVLGAGGRFRMLETIRAYAAERLDASGEQHATAARHAAHFLAVAEAARQTSRLAASPGLRALDLERGNLEAALRWTAEHDHDAHVRLAVALVDYWFSTRQKEAAEWATSALRFASDDRSRAWLLYGRGRLRAVGFRDVGEDDAREAVALFERASDHEGAALALLFVAGFAMRGAEPAAANAILARAERHAERSGDPYVIGVVQAIGQDFTDLDATAVKVRAGARNLVRAGARAEAAHALGGLAYSTISTGRLDLTEGLIRESLALVEGGEDPFFRALVHGNAGIAGVFLGWPADEVAHHFAVQAEAMRVGPAWMREWMLAENRLGRAALAGREGDHAAAARLAGQAARAPQIVSAVESIVDAELERRFLDPAREALGDSEWRRLFDGAPPGYGAWTRSSAVMPSASWSSSGQ